MSFWKLLYIASNVYLICLGILCLTGYCNPDRWFTTLAGLLIIDGLEGLVRSQFEHT